MAIQPHTPQRFVPWVFRSVWRLLAIMLVVLVIPFSALLITIMLKINNSLEKQAVSQNKTASRLAAKIVEEHFDGMKEYTESYAKRKKFSELIQLRDSSGVIHEHLKELVVSNENFSRVFVSDTSGKLIYDYPQDPAVIGRNFAHRDWYKGVTNTGSYISEIYQRAALGEPYVVSIATTIYDSERNAIGYLVAQNTIESLVFWLGEIEPLARSKILLADHHGNMLMHNDIGQDTLSNLNVIPILKELLSKEKQYMRGRDPTTGEKSLLQFLNVGKYNWTIVMSQPMDIIMEPIGTMKIVVVIMVVSCFVMLLLIGFFWVNSLRTYHLKMLQMSHEIRLLNIQLGANVNELHHMNDTLEQKVKERTSELTIKNEELVRINEDMDKFVYSASHDLKTPVVNLEALTDMLFRKEPLKEENKMIADNIRHSIQKAKETLSALAKSAQAGKAMDEDIQSVPFEDVLSEVTEDLNMMIVSSNASIHSDFSEASEVIFPIAGIKSILYNLINNAIKYRSPARNPEISITTQKENNFIVLTVKDNGLGINLKKDSEKIFQMFRRAHDHVEGTGIGLYIVKKIVENKGGKIVVNSEVGKGSIFTVYLPNP